MSLAALCVRRPVFAVMLVSFLVVLGLFSFRDLGVDLFPRADPATVNITIRLPGATPEEVTTQVVLPIEEALSTLAGLDELTVMTTEGNTRITANSCSSATSRTRPRTCARRSRGPCASCPRTSCPRSSRRPIPTPTRSSAWWWRASAACARPARSPTSRSSACSRPWTGSARSRSPGRASARSASSSTPISSSPTTSPSTTSRRPSRARTSRSRAAGSPGRQRTRRAHGGPGGRAFPVRRDRGGERGRRAGARPRTRPASRTPTPSRAPGTTSRARTR